MSTNAVKQTRTKTPKKEAEDRTEEPPSLVPLPPRPVLRFTLTAWAKLVFFREYGPTEIGGFGITEPDDLLRIVDFVTVAQEAAVASIAFHDEAVGDFFEAQVDAGRKPEQFARHWCHTHPGASPEPSRTDEETFHRVFGQCDWALMLILAHNGRTSARLRFNIGPGGQIAIPVTVDYTPPFPASDREAWETEYHRNIKKTSDTIFEFPYFFDPAEEFYDASYPRDWVEELEWMDPEERRQALEEWSCRPWFPDDFEESEGVDHESD